MPARSDSLTPYSTAAELAAALRARRVSSTELVDRSIARIEAHDGKLNAVVVRDFERARQAALEADKALARGEHRPLLGVPMTVKEAFNVAGLSTSWGLPGMENLRASEDTIAIARLKAAGAIVLGKTNVPFMLADWQSANQIYGATNNPWDLKRTPGGSSGGGSAALAAGYVPLEFGTDLVGSLRVPAHFCGIFAHKPSGGLVPMRGFGPPGIPILSVDAEADLVAIGPMARSATDLALALDAVAGPDAEKAVGYTLAMPPSRHADLKDFRVFIIDEHPMVRTSKAVRSALQKMEADLATAGSKIGRKSSLLPDLDHISNIYGQLLGAFTGGNLPGPMFRELQAKAAALSPDDMSPDAMNARANVMSHHDWVAADRQRRGIAHQWRQFFAEWDVVLCPVTPTTAFPHETREPDARRISIDGEEVHYWLQSVWAGPATLTGQPSTAMPIGRSAEGLPIGMQIVGPYLEDRTTIGFAELVEREFGGFVAPHGYEKES
jgi:amidase